MPDVVQILVPAPPAVVQVTVPGQVTAVQVVERGPQGPAGDAMAAYDHVQASPASTWTVNHNLGRIPIVGVRSVGGIEIEGDVIHTSVNQTQISFNVPTAGTARFL